MTVSEDGKNIGYLDFSVYEDTPYIQMINVKEPYRRKGYATQMIKHLQKETYTSNVISPEYEWSINLDSENKDIKDVLTWTINSNKITVQWTAMVSGSFVIHYGPLTKNVVVESLF